MARWWRIHEVGGRFYPDFTQDGGKTWLREYVIARRNGYATKRGAREWAALSIRAGSGDDWWEQTNTLTQDEQTALSQWFAQHDIHDDIKSEEVMQEERRLGFVRWLIEQGRLGADDQSSDDTVEQGVMF